MSHHFRVSSLILFAMLMLSSAGFASEDFILPDVQGVKHKLSDYRGKWVVVNYWATWCPPCLAEIPELEEFHVKHKDKDAVVLGVNLEDIDAASLRQFIDEYSITYTVLRGESENGIPFGPFYGLPSTYLISPAGEVATIHLGPVTRTAIEEFINSEAVPSL